MIISDTFSLAFRNLGQAKLRTTLTTLGVAIGIASLAGMVSLGEGLEEQTVGRFMASGVFDSVTVMSPGDLPGFAARLGGAGARGRGGSPGRGGAAGTAQRKSLDDAAIAEIGQLPHVKEVFPNVNVPVEVQIDQSQGFATLVGVPMSQRDTGAFQTFTAGSFFADDKAHSCVLSLDFAKRITDRDPKDLIGQPVTVAYAVADAASQPADQNGMSPMPRRTTETFLIAGIVERPANAGLPGGGGNISGLMIPLEQAKIIFSQALTGRQSLLGPAPSTAKKTYQALTVKVTSPASVQDVEDKIAAAGYTAFSLMDALKNARRLFIVLDIVLGLIGSIALVVSSLGIVNTMVMSILERTREIGIMKAIGGSDADVRGIFLVEAAAIGLLGGAVGVTLAWIVGRVIMFGANLYVRSQQADAPAVDVFAMPLWLIALAIGFSVLVSLIAGSFPARRAARLNPIEALRHD